MPDPTRDASINRKGNVTDAAVPGWGGAAACGSRDRDARSDAALYGCKNKVAAARNNYNLHLVFRPHRSGTAKLQAIPTRTHDTQGMLHDLLSRRRTLLHCTSKRDHQLSSVYTAKGWQ